MANYYCDLVAEACTKHGAAVGKTLTDVMRWLAEGMKGRQSWLFATDDDEGLSAILVNLLRYVHRDSIGVMGFRFANIHPAKLGQATIVLVSVYKRLLSKRKMKAMLRKIGVEETIYDQDILVIGNDPDFVLIAVDAIKEGKATEGKPSDFN